MSKKIKEDYFNRHSLDFNLKQKSVRGGFLVLSSQGIKFVLNIGSMAILARLLTPEDFGLVAMVMVITNFINLFKDLGLTLATVQKPNITHQQVSSLFWVNVLIGLILALFTIAIAPLLSLYFNEPRVIDITLFLSIGFVCGGFAIQHQALLRRTMQFKRMIFLEVGALIISTSCALYAAYYGLGYWSLVIKALSLNICMLVGVWLICAWRPGRYTRKSGIKNMLSFGGHLAVYNALNYFAMNIDKFLLGRFSSTEQLGLYSRSHQLVLLPVQLISSPLSGVANPALSRLQADPVKFSRYYLKALSIIAYLTMPIIALAIPLANELVFIFLGDQWGEAVPLLQVLAIAAFWQPVLGTLQWVLVSTGQTRRLKSIGILVFFVYVIVTMIGLQWGVLGVATGVAISATVLVPILFFFGLRKSFLSAADVFVEIFNPVVLSIVIGVGVHLCYLHLIEYDFITRVSISIFSAIIILSFMLALFKGIRIDFFNIFNTVRTLRNKN